MTAQQHTGFTPRSEVKVRVKGKQSMPDACVGPFVSGSQSIDSKVDSVSRLRPPISEARLHLSSLLESARRGKLTLVMGILNVTPDSFSDGGRYHATQDACARAAEMIADGADILDIGGESTRPVTFHRTGTQFSVSVQEELDRIMPVISMIAERFPSVPISVDTYKSEVAEAACRAGAVMVNDVSAMRADSRMAGVVSEYGVGVCLMHMPGLPGEVGTLDAETDIITEIRSHLENRIREAVRADIPPENIVIDPGIGFGKTVVQNLEIMRRQRELLIDDIPLLIGTSRKSVLGAVLGGAPPEERLEATAASVAIAIANGATIVRVHDVRQMKRVSQMTDAIVRGWPTHTHDDCRPTPGA